MKLIKSEKFIKGNFHCLNKAISLLFV